MDEKTKKEYEKRKVKEKEVEEKQSYLDRIAELEQEKIDANNLAYINDLKGKKPHMADFITKTGVKDQKEY